jgi:hypothetical protein
MPYFNLFNLFEAGLWFSLAIALWIRSRRATSKLLTVVAGSAFAAFGASVPRRNPNRRVVLPLVAIALEGRMRRSLDNQLSPLF